MLFFLHTNTSYNPLSEIFNKKQEHFENILWKYQVVTDSIRRQVLKLPRMGNVAAYEKPFQKQNKRKVSMHVDIFHLLVTPLCQHPQTCWKCYHCKHRNIGDYSTVCRVRYDKQEPPDFRYVAQKKEKGFQ